MLNQHNTLEPMRALIINCTLKRSPEFSNTGALAEKAIKLLEENRLEVEPEMIRLVDYDVKPGTGSDMKSGDKWPEILEKIKKCDIFIIATPIWMGHLASTAQRVIERLNAIFHEDGFKNASGQYITYNKVAGCLVTGNEDGAHSCAAQALWAMQELGFTIPPNANAYWVGMAGGEKDYIAAGGRKYYYTNFTLRLMIANLVYFAKILRGFPITTNVTELEQQAKDESDLPKEEGEEKEQQDVDGNKKGEDKPQEKEEEPAPGDQDEKKAKKDDEKEKNKEDKKAKKKDKG